VVFAFALLTLYQTLRSLYGQTSHFVMGSYPNAATGEQGASGFIKKHVTDPVRGASFMVELPRHTPKYTEDHHEAQ
jgi:hypothetical protein